jgi:hypothetical protein
MRINRTSGEGVGKLADGASGFAAKAFILLYFAGCEAQARRDVTVRIVAVSDDQRASQAQRKEC